MAPENGSLREGRRVLVVQGELHLARLRGRVRVRVRVRGRVRVRVRVRVRIRVRVRVRVRISRASKTAPPWRAAI